MLVGTLTLQLAVRYALHKTLYTTLRLITFQTLQSDWPATIVAGAHVYNASDS